MWQRSRKGTNLKLLVSVTGLNTLKFFLFGVFNSGVFCGKTSLDKYKSRVVRRSQKKNSPLSHRNLCYINPLNL